MRPARTSRGFWLDLTPSTSSRPTPISSQSSIAYDRRPRTMPPAEVFLSHSSADGEMAHRIAQILVAHGVPVFFSPRNIIGAQQWQDEILKALERCDWFLVLLSSDAVDSMWVK